MRLAILVALIGISSPFVIRQWQERSLLSEVRALRHEAATLAAQSAQLRERLLNDLGCPPMRNGLLLNKAKDRTHDYYRRYETVLVCIYAPQP